MRDARPTPLAGEMVRLHSEPVRRSATSAQGRSKRWQPPEGLTPEDVQAVIAAAPEGRDRLLLRVLWATGGRINEVLALRAMDVRKDSLILPNEKNPAQRVKRVYLSAGDASLPGELLLWQQEQGLPNTAPLFVSRKRAPDGGYRAVSDVQAWRIVKAASLRAGVYVLALRDSKYGAAGQPAPIHPHIFRHARARQTLRQTKSLPLVKRQMGWAGLMMQYLTVGDEEARQMMAGVDQ